MKKFALVVLFIGLCFSVFAYDETIYGKWGFIARQGEVFEVISFNDRGIVWQGTHFIEKKWIVEETNNTIVIVWNGNNIVITYFLLSENSLLFGSDVNGVIILSKL
ncbi:hypothetical protein AGMMS49944_17390 [Spirochaetia bacterium]|nr:hypothetical protein AGMMS49944_17390 [Spirochaetia bacterium]